MRINRFIALATGMSRRAADDAIAKQRVQVDGRFAQLGEDINEATSQITLAGRVLRLPSETTTILLNKPVGYVCSRDGQGSKTIYELLPPELRHLKTVGRLDKDSSGLILLTNAGELAHQLTHPSFSKQKVYEIELDKPLGREHLKQIEQGVNLDDGMSSLQLTVNSQQQKTVNRKLSTVYFFVRMHEGRNRQIRRTFATLGYKVTKLHRTQFGPYSLKGLDPGEWQSI